MSIRPHGGTSSATQVEGKVRHRSGEEARSRSLAAAALTAQAALGDRTGDRRQPQARFRPIPFRSDEHRRPRSYGTAAERRNGHTKIRKTGPNSTATAQANQSDRRGCPNEQQNAGPKNRSRCLQSRAVTHPHAACSLQNLNIACYRTRRRMPSGDFPFSM